jgi:hypothetical protein
VVLRVIVTVLMGVGGRCMLGQGVVLPALLCLVLNISDVDAFGEAWEVHCVEGFHVMNTATLSWSVTLIC